MAKNCEYANPPLLRPVRPSANRNCFVSVQAESTYSWSTRPTNSNLRECQTSECDPVSTCRKWHFLRRCVTGKTYGQRHDQMFVYLHLLILDSAKLRIIGDAFLRSHAKKLSRKCLFMALPPNATSNGFPQRETNSRKTTPHGCFQAAHKPAPSKIQAHRRK